ncbi:outer membrane protein assembly factor BamD [Candidatus Endowatersipora endosymbiont of Watersipora subatra]|uniref:outer membrane protein assembly factor BamD n=1 Tax=Candidatus Endowatersipora endosymbiont of Watersipora subatra TaxID=3077946 RepID=UPI00312C6E8F
MSSLSALLKVLALSTSLFLVSCATDIDGITFSDLIMPAEQVYNNALAYMKKGDYKEAQKQLKTLDLQHPYSLYAQKGSLMATYIAYQKRNYEEAISQGRRFLSRYPAHKASPYALYLIGMSHYARQTSDIRLDQSDSQKTYQVMNELVDTYPDSQYVEEAKRKMRISKEQIAGQEMGVGRYYQERHEFLAAINRFRTILEMYQETQYVEEALARLVETYYALGLTNESQTAAGILGKQFPNSKWYNYSYALLKKKD